MRYYCEVKDPRWSGFYKSNGEGGIHLEGRATASAMQLDVAQIVLDRCKQVGIQSASIVTEEGTVVTGYDLSVVKPTFTRETSHELVHYRSTHKGLTYELPLVHNRLLGLYFFKFVSGNVGDVSEADVSLKGVSEADVFSQFMEAHRYSHVHARYLVQAEPLQDEVQEPTTVMFQGRLTTVIRN